LEIKASPDQGHPSLFLFAGTQGRLPARTLLAWRRGNDLDLLFLGFFGFPIASLLAFGHVNLSLGFDGYVGIAYAQSPIDAAGNAVMIKLGLRPGDSERKNGTG
jgi:hypothetical protein